MNGSINWLHVPSMAMGYGRAGVCLAEEFRRLGLDVYDHLPTPDEIDGRSFAHLNSGRSGGIAPVVCWQSVPTHATGWYDQQYPVIASMWEASKLPPSFRETLHNFAQVIVPSTQNLELFSQYHPNVSYVPLGVDPALWHPENRPGLGAYFNFLVAGSGPRKGTDLVHRAFQKLWPTSGSWGSGPIPQLIMKNPRGEKFYGERVQMITGRLTDADEIALYATAHCYVQPSRGEGFGLQPLQAIAQGCPTILTDAHGHASFAHLGFSISAKPTPSAYFIYGDAGDWWEPDFDELCDQMRWVYDNYNEAAMAAEVWGYRAIEEFTWARTAQGMVDAIGPERFEMPMKGPYTWFKPDAQMFKVVTNQDWNCDIADASYHFRRGAEAWVPADVKRVLFEANILDPACLTGDDNGLLPIEVHRLPDYIERHSYCPTCGRHQATGERRSDLIYSRSTQCG
jgi:glycosyltransferase involved in cell wall biosynthesis